MSALELSINWTETHTHKKENSSQYLIQMFMLPLQCPLAAKLTPSTDTPVSASHSIDRLICTQIGDKGHLCSGSHMKAKSPRQYLPLDMCTHLRNRPIIPKHGTYGVTTTTATMLSRRIVNQITGWNSQQFHIRVTGLRSRSTEWEIQTSVCAFGDQDPSAVRLMWKYQFGGNIHRNSEWRNRKTSLTAADIDFAFL